MECICAAVRQYRESFTLVTYLLQCDRWNRPGQKMAIVFCDNFKDFEIFLILYFTVEHFTQKRWVTFRDGLGQDFRVCFFVEFFSPS